MLGRGLARRDLGDPAGAAADARRALDLLKGLPSRAGDDLFLTACCHAALAGLAGQDGAGVPAGEAKAEADQAMALLRKAVDMGYRNAAAFRTESALDPLRKREDFKKLLSGAGEAVARQAGEVDANEGTRFDSRAFPTGGREGPSSAERQEVRYCRGHRARISMCGAPGRNTAVLSELRRLIDFENGPAFASRDPAGCAVR